MHPILNHEQPAGEALFRLVKPVTGGNLAETQGFFLNKLENAGADLLRRVKCLSAILEEGCEVHFPAAA